MSNPQDSLPAPTESVISAGIVDELKTSFLSYAMSVIVSRALPDVRDGLKPVHRRILYAMYDLGMFHAKPFKKSARIVGEVIGKYHPHGDSAVYDAMVRMAQDFSLRLPLIDGQGNFGSVDGDSPAAMRYTEARLTKAAGEILADLDKDTVEFVPNYDEQLKEPVVLATKLPNLLINGSVGIAVGMATNIPPHNVREICSALIKLIDAPESTDDELIACVSGPDFPTGGIIYGRAGILAAYKLGSGKITLRARTHIEEQKQGGKQALILDEIPYQVNKAMLIEHIADLVKDKVIEGISDIRDESDRDGMRVVIELKRDVSSEIVLNQLFKHSRLEITFGIHNLCLVNGVPKTLTLRQMLSYFLDHRFVVITKRTEFDLKKTQDRLHILEGLKIAIEQLDKAISLIRAASEPSVARVSLISAFCLDEIQAQAILDMKLQRLTALERDGILEEVAELAALAHELEGILASPQKKYAIIRSELEAVADAYQSARKTEIIDSDVDVEIEDLIESRQDVVTITHEGYVKRVSLDEYRAQRRGGRGVSAATTKDTDFVEKVFSAHTKSYILFFTNTGQVHWLKVWKIPEASKVGKGKALVNLLQLTASEKVSAAIPISEFKEDQYLLLCTKEGTVKKSSLSEYANPRMGGIRAIRLSDQDELITAVVTDGKAQIILATAKGMAIRFEEADAREVGRVSMGVRGIRLDEGDRVVSMVVANDTQSLLSITANGYGKRSPVSEYRLIGRGGKGVINIQTNERNGDVVSVQCVQDETGILLMTKGGITLRTRCDQVSVIGRNTQGVRLMRLDEGDAVVSCTVVEDVQ